MNLAAPAQWHQLNILGHTGFEPHSGGRGYIQPVAVSRCAVERQRSVGLWKVDVATHLDRSVTGVDDLHVETRDARIDLDISSTVKDFAGNHEIG